MTETKHKEHITSEHFGIPADFADRAENYAQWRIQGLSEQLAAAQALKDAQVAQQAEQGWQPMETAPKDAIILLGLPLIGNIREGDRRVYEGRWNQEQKTWTSVNGFLLLTAATHWTPLPRPPAAAPKVLV